MIDNLNLHRLRRSSDIRNHFEATVAANACSCLELVPPTVTGVLGLCISGFWVSDITDSSERCDLNAGRLRVRVRSQRLTTPFIRNKGTTGNSNGS